MRIHGVKEIQERRLFHGTEISNVDSICKYNFDVRLAGQHGHLYGKGKLNDTVITVCATNSCNVDLTVHQSFLSSSEFLCFYLGTYFAKHAAYADNYSSSSTDPLPLYGGETRGVQGEYTKIIFVARVMIGQSTVGQKYFQKPDHGSSENSHYSCVDDINCPTMFVIFDANQIYPEYLIQYK